MTSKEELNKYKKIIENYLEDIMPKDQGYQHKIFEAMRYSIFAGGKRLRPFLVLKTCEIMSGSYKEALPFAAAIEMIHTYSLIHDDLPAMDDDDFRRGKPTNHKVFGEGLAVLAGDGLLNLAYETMTKTLLENKESAHKLVRAMDVIARAAGVFGMIGGQVADIISENKKVDKEILDFIHLNKTSALIEASIVAGGIIGGARDNEIEYLKEYGRSIGLGFQIRDDILDKIGTMESLGKDIGSDEDNNKVTYLSLHGMENSIKIANALCESAKGSINNIRKDGVEILEELADYLVIRES